MLKYIVILLSDESTSFCHYDTQVNRKGLIPIETLRQGIRFGMMENLMIQFVYPQEILPKEYAEAINMIDHSVIAPAGCPVEADVVVFNDWNAFGCFRYTGEGTFVVRTTLEQLLAHSEQVTWSLARVTRLNIVLTDIAEMKDSDFDFYKGFLEKLSNGITAEYQRGHHVQCNLLTDRIQLKEMNNCNAGTESITLAPDGHFYICPAFYYDGAKPVGSLSEGLDIRNPQLYRLDHAPLCRICDAYQCKRCVWLNQKTTLEVNTPSHEQCVIAHLERNQSRALMHELWNYGLCQEEMDIKEICYLDPFDVKQEW
ncbi:MAG: CXXX repeat peptide maturase [Prevotella sp.]|nr:CXXX repeat peptide maturase [Prevotella sp.]